MKFAPIAEGMFAGEKAGLTSDLILWEHTRELDYKTLEGEYLVGFGAGFVKGQRIRESMKLVQNGMTLEEMTDCYVLVDEQWRYKTHLNSEKFLTNIDGWNNHTLPAQLVAKSLDFWKENKFQRSLDLIRSYYLDELRLQSYISFDKLTRQLQDTRGRKRKKLISADAYYKELSALETRLDTWLKKHVL